MRTKHNLVFASQSLRIIEDMRDPLGVYSEAFSTLQAPEPLNSVKSEGKCT